MSKLLIFASVIISLMLFTDRCIDRFTDRNYHPVFTGVFIRYSKPINATIYKADTPLFTGKILYKNSFVDFKGNDLTEKFAPYFGRESHYYLDNKNYKSIDEQNNWTYLYNSESNIYYSFSKDKTARKFDGSTKTGQKFIVTKLEERAKIAGYDCKALRVEKENGVTIYFYSPAIKTSPETYSKHNFGDWNKYLAATDGALPLKFITTDHKNGYIWTSVATQVTKMNLTAKDFEFPSDFKIKQ